jgi:hypothetical protein
MIRKQPLSAILWSTLALAAGCSQVLGLGDYETVDPSGAVAGEGGEVTAGGSTNVGGKSAGGNGNVAGEAGDAGSGGAQGGTAGTSQGGSSSAGEAGAAGAGGEPPAPMGPFVGCNGTPFEGSEAVVRSCLLRVSCLAWDWPSDSISRCVSQNTQNAYEGTKCTLDAQTCGDIATCEGARLERDFCADKDPKQYCNGDEVVSCDSGFPHARDCKKYGGKCKDFGKELPSGSTVDCELPDVTCTESTATDACGGPQSGYRYQCEGTIAYGAKCSNFAASCQVVDGDAGCYYPLNTCSQEGVTCTNGRATWCDGDSRVTYDCGSVGLGCATEGDYYEDSGRQCAAPGCTVDDLVDCQETCDGSKLTFCYGGAPVTVDCKDYGFDVCKDYTYDCADGAVMGDCLYTDDMITFAECEYE